MLRTGLDAVRLRFRLQVWGLLSLLRVRGGGGGRLDSEKIRLLCCFVVFLGNLFVNYPKP